MGFLGDIKKKREVQLEEITGTKKGLGGDKKSSIKKKEPKKEIAQGIESKFLSRKEKFFASDKDYKAKSGFYKAENKDSYLKGHGF